MKKLYLLFFAIILNSLGCSPHNKSSGTPFVVLENLAAGSKYENERIATTGYLYAVTPNRANSTLLDEAEYGYILYSRVEHASLGLDWFGVFLTAREGTLDRCNGEYVQVSGIFDLDDSHRKYIKNSGHAFGAIGLRESILENDKEFHLEAFTDCQTGKLDTGRPD